MSTSVLALSFAMLVGCSDGTTKAGSTDPTPTASATPTPGTASASETPYLPVPDGIELTVQGSDLVLGDEAVVAYAPRQDEVGVLTITVDRIEKTSFKESFAGWKLDAATRAMTPYFVRATLTNKGESDLGGREVPLYVVDSADTLIQASRFKGSFKPCPSKPFPKAFAQGATQKFCLVYLAPEGQDLAGVTFRPSEEFDPITWTGPIAKAQPDKPTKPRNKKGKGKKGR